MKIFAYLLAVVVLVLGSVYLSGCSGSVSTTPASSDPGAVVTTPIGSVTVNYNTAEMAGVLAAKGFLMVESPTAAQATTLSIVANVVSSNLTGYMANGFEAAQTAIDNAIGPMFSAGQALDLTLAEGAVSLTLTGLDTLFAANPSWTTDSNVAASIISGFCAGVSKTFASYAPTASKAFVKTSTATKVYVVKPATPALHAVFINAVERPKVRPPVQAATIKVTPTILPIVRPASSVSVVK